MSGLGSASVGVSWGGEVEYGRFVGDGQYDARVTIVDNMGQEWDYQSMVEVMGFKDRTRTPIRVEISGSENHIGGTK